MRRGVVDHLGCRYSRGTVGVLREVLDGAVEPEHSVTTRKGIDRRLRDADQSLNSDQCLRPGPRRER